MNNMYDLISSADMYFNSISCFVFLPIDLFLNIKKITLYRKHTKHAGKAQYIIFRALNQHGFLGQLQEKKLVSHLKTKPLNPSSALTLSFKADIVVTCN